MRVLVTGATTPIGAALVRALLDSGAGAVLAVGLEPEPGCLPVDPRLHYRAVDLTRSRALHTLLHGPAHSLAIDAVVHGALHRRARDRGAAIHRQNVEATRELLRLAERHPTIRRFVHISHADVYRVDAELPALIGEDHPLAIGPRSPQRVLDRIEADLLVCARMGMARMSIAVLRMAEVIEADCGSQLHDYLGSRICLRPVGYDPMINLLSLDDAVAALVQAVRSTAQGVFNIPGADTLPLSRLIRRSGRHGIPVPGPVLAPLYLLRALARGTDFRYRLNASRMHWSGVLDGSRAAAELGYHPGHPLVWHDGGEAASAPAAA